MTVFAYIFRLCWSEYFLLYRCIAEHRKQGAHTAMKATEKVEELIPAGRWSHRWEEKRKRVELRGNMWTEGRSENTRQRNRGHT